MCFINPLFKPLYFSPQQSYSGILGGMTSSVACFSGKHKKKVVLHFCLHVGQFEVDCAEPFIFEEFLSLRYSYLVYTRLSKFNKEM